MTLQELIREARELSVDEQKQLVKALLDLLAQPRTSLAQRTRSLREFRGIGASLYDGTDAQAHVNQMRDEWDEKS
jgi:hypothetical protein